jgi:hypothetical protein
MPKVLLKFFEDAVERTEEEIAELRAGGLVRDDPAAGQPVLTPATPPVRPPDPAGKSPDSKENAK